MDTNIKSQEFFEQYLKVFKSFCSKHYAIALARYQSFLVRTLTKMTEELENSYNLPLILNSTDTFSSNLSVTDFIYSYNYKNMKERRIIGEYLEEKGWKKKEINLSWVNYYKNFPNYPNKKEGFWNGCNLIALISVGCISFGFSRFPSVGYDAPLQEFLDMLEIRSDFKTYNNLPSIKFGNKIGITESNSNFDFIREWKYELCEDVLKILFKGSTEARFDTLREGIKEIKPRLESIIGNIASVRSLYTKRFPRIVNR